MVHLSRSALQRSYCSMLVFVLALTFLPSLVTGQGFFEQFFGGQQQQHRPSAAEQWRAHGASIDCSGYLCPTTFDCVKKPVDCPCPAEQDMKCYTGNGDSYVCVRGDNECQRVNQARKAI